MKKSGLFLWFVLVTLIPGLRAQTTFNCDGKLYFFREDPNNTNGYLAYFDNYTTATTVTNMCPLPTQAHNGLAANPVNNMLYYMEGQALRSIDANCNSVVVCPNLGFSTLSGACDNLGRYWTITQGNGLVAVDINTCTIVKGPYTGFLGALDIAFNLYDCHIYITSGSNLLKVDTNGVTVTTYPLSFTPSGTYGGTAFGPNGLLYGVAGGNGNGNLSVIDIQNLTSSQVHTFSQGPTFARSDMASFACVRVDAYPTATPITGCAPLNVQFVDTSIAFPGPVTSWLWDFGDNSPTSTTQNPNHTYMNPGTYTVTLVVSTTTGCNLFDYDTATLVITVTTGPTVTITNPVSICSGASTTLIATGGGIYQWSTGATTASITESPTITTTYTVTVTVGQCVGTATTQIVVTSLTGTVSLPVSICPGTNATLSAGGGSTFLWQPGGMTTGTVSVNPTASTTYTVIVSDGGCSDTLQVQVSLLAAPVVTVTDAQTCEGGSVVLVATGGDAYLWSPGNMTGSSISVSPLTSGTYTVIATNLSGCTSTGTGSVTVYSGPVAGFTTDPSDLEPGEFTVYFQNTSTGAVSWFWDFGDGNTSTLEHPQHTYQNPGTYIIWLIVTNANGCTDSISRTVEVTADWSLYLPNAFTPEGNGLNDVFYAVGENIAEFEMYIFDRWGNQIFHSLSMDHGWDGKVQGGSSDKIVQEDVYVWKVRAKDVNEKEHFLVGSVTVIR